MNKRSNHTAGWIAGGGVGLGVLGLMIGSFGTASAAPGDIVISIDRYVSGAPGAVIPLESRPVEDAFVGLVCAGSYTSVNNSSVHPGTNLIMSSNGSSATLTGVEDVPGETLFTSGPLTLGDMITISVELGSDGMASIEAALSLDCAQPTTTTEAPTTTAAPTTLVGSAGLVNTPTTTTTTPAVAAAAVVAPAGVSVATQGTALPTTGPDDTTAMLALAGAALALGVGAVRLTRRPR